MVEESVADVERPTGITILAITQFFVGIGPILVVLAGVALGGYSTGSGNEEFVAFFAIILYIVFILGYILTLIVGIVGAVISLTLGWGLWKVKKWSRSGTLVLALINIILALLPVALGIFDYIPAVIVQGIVVYYLTRPKVKEVFGVTGFLS